MVLRIIILFVTSLFCLEPTLSQDILKYRSKFVKPVCSGYCDEFLDQKSKSVRNSYWSVVSDRDGNVSYEAPSVKSTEYRSLSFGEVFYVIEERNGWLKLSKGSRTSGKEPKVGADNIDYGWVPKRRLLLWNYPLFDQQLNTWRRALLVPSLGTYMDNDFSSDISVYNSPNDKSLSDLSTMQDFAYVMKEENEYALLSKSYEINDLDVDKKLIGWVNKNYLTYIGNLVLSINSNESALSERLKKNTIKADCCVDLIWDHDNIEKEGELNCSIGYHFLDSKSEEKGFFRVKSLGVFQILDGTLADSLVEPNHEPFDYIFKDEFFEVCEARYGTEDDFCNVKFSSLVGEQVRLVRRIMFPSRLPQANHRPFMFNILIEEDELRTHLSVLRHIGVAYNDPPDKQRDALYDGFRQMLENYSGGDFTKDDFEKSSAVGLLEKTLGLTAEVAKYYYPNYLIGDILRKNKMPDALVEQEIERLRMLVSKMSLILKEGSYFGDSCFIYNPDDSDFSYYIYPLELLF